MPKKKDIKTRDNDGNLFNHFACLLELSLKDLREVLPNRQDEKKVVIRKGANNKIIMLIK